MTADTLALTYLDTAERAIADVVYDKLQDGTPIDALDAMQARAVLKACIKQLAVTHLALTLCCTDAVVGYGRRGGRPTLPPKPAPEVIA